MNTCENNQSPEHKSLCSKNNLNIIDYAKVFNLVNEEPQFEKIIDKACLAQEHVSQIIAADRNDLTHTKFTLQKEKNILTAIKGINPNDTTEAMLASQMITTHNAAMKAFEEAESYNMKKDPQYKKLSIASAALGNKLMRTYTMQMDALNKHRGKGQQKITVEHININNGGKAVVGNINTENHKKEEG